MKKKIFKQLLLLVFVFKFSLGEDQKIPTDASFMKFCDDVGGDIMTPQAVKKVVTQGQRCINADFGGVWAENQEEAEKACRLYGPFHLVSAKLDESSNILCTYEALFVCRNGFKQINGRCYRIENSLLSTMRSDAELICKGLKLQIYQHYDERTAAFINIFFPGLSAIWADIPSGGVLYDIAYESGDPKDEYAVVFGTANVYNAPYNSLVKIPYNHYAMVFCEYTPKESIMSLRATVEKWAPYIHKAVVNGAFTAWRTFGHHLPDLEIHGTLFEDHQHVCRNSLSALMNNKNAKMFDPKITFMNQLGGGLDKSMVFLAPFRRCKWGYRWCSASSAWEHPTVTMSYCWDVNKRYFWKGGYKTTDGAQNTCHLCRTEREGLGKEQYDLGYYMAYQENGKYEFYATRPRPAPVLCDVMFHGMGVYQNCDSGWTQFLRGDGSKACHKYHTEAKTRDAALEYCKNNYQATLAGWHEEDEMRKIFAFGTGWLSMKKNVNCRYKSEDQDNPCFEHKAFYDPDDVTNEEGKKAFVGGLYQGQPEGSAEYCFIYYEPHNGAHDWGCDVATFAFTCTKVTELKEDELDYGYKDD